MNVKDIRTDESLGLLKGLENEIHEVLDYLEEETTERMMAATTDVDNGAAGQRKLKSALRACFMSHYAATEADFERLWPRLRDDYFCKFTLEKFSKSLEPARGGTGTASGESQ